MHSNVSGFLPKLETHTVRQRDIPENLIIIGVIQMTSVLLLLIKAIVTVHDATVYTVEVSKKQTKTKTTLREKALV